MIVQYIKRVDICQEELLATRKFTTKSVARTYRDEGERANAGIGNTQWARKNEGPLLLRGVSPGEAAANAVSLHRVLPA